MCFKIAETGEAQGRLEFALKYYLKAAETVGRDNRFAVNALLRAARIYEDLDRLEEAEGMYKQVARMGIKESAYAKERLLSIRKAANKK